VSFTKVFGLQKSHFMLSKTQIKYKYLNLLENCYNKNMDGSKTETYWTILSVALQLEQMKPNRWTITELSKKSKFSRTTIYEYFKGDKSEILIEAVKLIGKDFASLNEEQSIYWETNNLADSIIETRDLIEKIPELLPFYFSKRVHLDDIGKEIRAIEEEYLIKISDHFQGISRDDTLAIWGVFMGLTFTPLLTNESIQKSVNALLAAFEK